MSIYRVCFEVLNRRGSHVPANVVCRSLGWTEFHSLKVYTVLSDTRSTVRQLFQGLVDDKSKYGVTFKTFTLQTDGTERRLVFENPAVDPDTLLCALGDLRLPFVYLSAAVVVFKYPDELDSNGEVEDPVKAEEEPAAPAAVVDEAVLPAAPNADEPPAAAAAVPDVEEEKRAKDFPRLRQRAKKQRPPKRAQPAKNGTVKTATSQSFKKA